ncbi:Macrophage mannose receptor 1 [Holothuria leucospilota]|uniref:Macrophage mannose receptor 1 n=1 Tax=Holothuria leucospilota TaxID=206669 RepID=A0A9Q1CB69_HOLLE|nr:Macrophage mannose receptor 1 [Holothuria leucospilota]
MLQGRVMDHKISYAVLGLVATIILLSENARGKEPPVMVFTKPFFSSDITGNSQTFKNQAIVPASECQSAYTKAFNGSRYKFVDSCQGLTRHAAQAACERDSSHLVFIESEEENDFLVREVSPDTKYWIGLFSPKRHLFWDNGKEITFANLDRPKTTSGCFVMSTFDRRHWLDKPCENKFGFICEYECSTCPDNATACFNNSRYEFFDGPKISRFAAKSECENDSSHLVFIESKEENDFLVGKAQDGTEYWIGLHDRPQLFWDDGNQVKFTNIDEDNRYTFNVRSGCYRMSNYGRRLWLDKPCSAKLSYICECNAIECSPGYNYSFNGSSYKFVNSSQMAATRLDARTDCERDSSHLVFIESKDENDFLAEKTRGSVPYWIGLFSPKRHIFWDNNVSEMTFANLDLGRRGTFNDHSGCFQMSASGERHWLDKPCEKKDGFICEYEGPNCTHNGIISFNTSCYKFVNHSLASRFAAQSKCADDSMHLVHIETKEENNFLVGKAQNGTKYWIGLHDRPQLFWDNGKQVEYANIDAGRDRTYSVRSGCYQMSDHEEGHIWVDRGCGQSSAYICENEGN